MGYENSSPGIPGKPPGGAEAVDRSRAGSGIGIESTAPRSSNELDQRLGVPARGEFAENGEATGKFEAGKGRKGTRVGERTSGGVGKMGEGGGEEGGEGRKGEKFRRVKERGNREKAEKGTNGGKRGERGGGHGGGDGGGDGGGGEGATLMIPEFQAVGGESRAMGKEGLSLRVVSYNILAQAYVKSELFPHSPPQSLRQRNRFKALLTLLPALSADFLCVQEMDEYEGVYRQPMAAAGWESVYVKRPGKKRDGSGIFYRSSRFRLLRSQPIHFNDLVPPNQPVHLEQPAQPGQEVAPSPYSSEESRGLSASHVSEATQTQSAGPDSSESRDLCDPRVRFKRDCVAIVAAFQERASEEKEGEEAEDGESMAGGEVVREGIGGRGGERGQQGEGRVVVVASSHIFWDPACADVKLAQAHYLLQQVAQFRSSIVTSGHTTAVAAAGGGLSEGAVWAVLCACAAGAQLLEQRTSWGQQVPSVLLAMLCPHWLLIRGPSSPLFRLPIPPILEPPPSQLLEQRTSWGQQVSSVLLAMLAAAVLASLSVLPTASPVYDFVWTRVMPMAVALVLLETDVTSAFTQSGPGLLAFMLGAAGTIAGTLVGFSLAGPSLGVEGWKVAACFCATYIGGSVNYAATAKALGMDITAGAAAASTGASLLTAGMAVDNLLMAAYFSVLAALPDSWPKPWESLTLSIAAAASACALADKLAVHLPPVMASAQLALAAVLASLLSTIGASASVSEAMSAGGGLLAFVATVLMVHIVVVLLGGRLLNIPLDILMVASNANVGGPATAAAMASARNWPQLVRPAVLLGTFGYTIGTAIAFLLGINVLQPMAAAALAKVL
ncbi:unnamed protein product [Closterium sp. Naga37s-1]|nr:unnamed protein product [Closterium sp. Naga37s-1]